MSSKSKVFMSLLFISFLMCFFTPHRTQAQDWDKYFYDPSQFVISLQMTSDFFLEAHKAADKLGYSTLLFDKGIAPARRSDKWGFINMDIEQVIPLKYEEVTYFLDDYDIARVKLNGKYGYIDRKGKVVIPIKYDDISAFKDDVAFVKINNKCGIIGLDGYEIIPLTYDQIYHYSEEYHIAKVKLNGKFGLIDRKGDELISPRYDQLGEFKNREAFVQIADKWGIISTSGEELVPCMYDNISKYEQKNIVVTLGDKKGLVDRTGALLTPVEFDDVLQYKDGIVCVTSDLLFGVMNEFGQEILPIKYQSVVFSDNGFYCLLNDELSFYNYSGVQVAFDKQQPLKMFGEHSLSLIRNENKFYRVQGAYLAYYAAQEGNDKAMYGVALLSKVTGDIQESLKWADKSAELGNVDALHFLVNQYYDGKDVEKDYVKVANYLTLLLDHDLNKIIELNMCLKLSEIYAQGGFGLAKDEKKADYYSKKYAKLVEEFNSK